MQCDMTKHVLVKSPLLCCTCRECLSIFHCRQWLHTQTHPHLHTHTHSLTTSASSFPHTQVIVLLQIGIVTTIAATRANHAVQEGATGTCHGGTRLPANQQPPIRLRRMRHLVRPTRTGRDPKYRLRKQLDNVQARSDPVSLCLTQRTARRGRFVCTSVSTRLRCRLFIVQNYAALFVCLDVAMWCQRPFSALSARKRGERQQRQHQPRERQRAS